MSFGKPIFALGPDNRYLFWSRTRLASNRLPTPIQQAFDHELVHNILCCAFTEDEDDWVFVYESRQESADPAPPSIAFGPNFSVVLKSRLTNNDAELKSSFGNAESLKIVLGPRGSFVAWDRSSGIWHNLPDQLDETLRSWAPNGEWLHGAPRNIALGCDQAYLVVPLNGTPIYGVPEKWPRLAQEIQRTWTPRMHNGQIWKHASFFSFSSSLPDSFVMVFGSRVMANITLTHSIPEEKQMARNLEEIARTIGPCEVRTSSKEAAFPRTDEDGWNKYQKAEEDKWREQAKKTREAFEQWESWKEEAFAKKYRASNQTREMRQQEQREMYEAWTKTCDVAFGKGDITTFPKPPEGACTCPLASCKMSKEESGFPACRHDVEVLLKGSGQYSTKWLRQERTKWHPDQFAKFCDPEAKMVLERPARELFSIFGQLIEGVNF